MPKGPSRPAPPTLPSRDDLLAYIARESERGITVGKREIARAFDLKGADRIALKRLLRDLEAETLVARRGKTLAKPGALPPLLVAEIAGTTPDGDLFARPVDWNESDGPAPRILLAATRRAKGRDKVRDMAPGPRDQVLLRVEKTHGDRDFRYAGRVVKIMPRERSRLLGVLRVQKDGSARLVPIDKKAQGREILIAAADLGEGRDGDLVSAVPLEIGRGRLGPTRARVGERLGSLASEKAVSLIAIHAHAIPHVFSSAALAEAQHARPATMAGREDWRGLPLVTIDPPDAKDHDDAVHAAPDENPGNAGGFVLSIAIADVAAYVRPGTALDREALERGNSVYFPDRVVPMLPERISNDLCSLRPNEDRPALALRAVVDAQGRALRHSFHRVMMRSAAKLAYAQAQAAIDGRPDDATGPLLDPVLRPLYAAYDALKRARDARASAGPRFARAQDPAEARRHRRPRGGAPPPRGAPAHRGVHDPRQCVRRGNLGARPCAAALPRA